MIPLTRINNISLERYADIFIYGLKDSDENENRKKTMNFLYQIEYLDKADKFIIETYNKYYKENIQIMEEWNSNYIPLLDLIKNKISFTDDFEKTKFDGIADLYVKLIKSDGSSSDSDKLMKDFIDPSILILSDVKCREYSLLVQLINIFLRLYIIIIKHNKLNDYGLVFDKYIEYLTYSQKAINESVDYFKSHTLKKYCN